MSENENKTDTLAQDLADRITAEPVQVLTADGTVSKRPVTVLVDLVRTIQSGAANVAREAIGAADAAVSTMAQSVLAVRSRVIVDGLPDWAGQSKVYKRAATSIIDAVAGATGGDARTRAAGTLQRATVRALPEYLVRYVGKELSLSLSEDDVRRVTRDSYGYDAFVAESDETVRTVLARVLVHWRISDPAHATRVKNWPICQWVHYSDGNGPKDRAPNGTSETNASALESLDVVGRFAGAVASSETVPVSGSLAAIVAGIRSVVHAVVGPNTHYGDGPAACEVLAIDGSEMLALLGRYLHAGGSSGLTATDAASLERILAPNDSAGTVEAIREATNDAPNDATNDATNDAPKNDAPKNARKNAPKNKRKNATARK